MKSDLVGEVLDVRDQLVISGRENLLLWFEYKMSHGLVCLNTWLPPGAVVELAEPEIYGSKWDTGDGSPTLYCLLWEVLLYMCCFCWLMNKEAALAQWLNRI